jgi:hypothetical protein
MAYTDAMAARCFSPLDQNIKFRKDRHAQPVEADAVEQKRQQQIKAAIGRGKAEVPL